jgi:hypothetical protein
MVQMFLKNDKIQRLSWNAGDPHFLSFLFGRAYYKEAYFKKIKKIYGYKIRHPITNPNFMSASTKFWSMKI